MSIMNFTPLGRDFYVCRTPEGFSDALIHFAGNKTEGKLISRGDPKFYPSLVSLSWGYSGYRYINANCISIDVLRNRLNQSV